MHNERRKVSSYAKLPVDKCGECSWARVPKSHAHKRMTLVYIQPNRNKK